VLLVVLRATLRALGDAPTRSLTALANRLGVTEAMRARWSYRRRNRQVVRSPAAALPHTRLPLLARRDERRIERPQDPVEQTRC